MESDRIREILEKYYAGESTLDEERMLMTYFTEEKNIPPDLVCLKEVFSHFKSSRKVQYPDIRRSSLYRFGVAASITIAMGLFIALGYHIHNKGKLPVSVIYHKNESDKAEKIILPDKTLIWLNKNSEITYPKKIKNNHNEITVNGEAYFEHFNEKNIYEIIANNTIVKTDISSSFNIRAMQDMPTTEVIVDSGIVRVYEGHNTNSLAIIVKAGYYCSVHRSQKLAFSSRIINENYKSWKTGELTFDNMPIATVANILSEYYNVHIELENRQIAYCEFSGTFKKQSLDYILNTIRSQLNLEITSTGDVITFSGKECI